MSPVRTKHVSVDVSNAYMITLLSSTLFGVAVYIKQTESGHVLYSFLVSQLLKLPNL
jgi:hypothetical protein